MRAVIAPEKTNRFASLQHFHNFIKKIANALYSDL